MDVTVFVIVVSLRRWRCSCYVFTLLLYSYAMLYIFATVGNVNGCAVGVVRVYHGVAGLHVVVVDNDAIGADNSCVGIRVADICYVAVAMHVSFVAVVLDWCVLISVYVGDVDVFLCL